ncbi:FUSC family protein, partial [Clavibacter nebraskensis]
PVDRAELDRMLARARELRPRHTKAVAEVDRGLESLTLNPLRRRHRALLEADRELLATLTVLVNRVVGMTRAVHDRYDPSLAEEPVVRGIATELTRAAHDVRLLAEHALPG